VTWTPGLNYHLPYPIETALTPQALRVNKIDIGFDMRRGKQSGGNQ
jgi:modulator of FtsH protease HflK